MTPPGRRTTLSPLRRASRCALAAGAVLAVAAGFGPVWVVRAGIAVALIAGLLGVRWAWLEVRQTRDEAGRRSVAELRGHSAQLTAERQRNLEVIDLLREHGEVKDEKLVQLQVTIGQLRTEISSLKGDRAAMHADLMEREHRITRLTATLADREAELAELRAEAEQEATVVAIPRYAAPADWDALPTAEDLWATGNHPTVVDLQKLAYPTATRPERRQA